MDYLIVTERTPQGFANADQTMKTFIEKVQYHLDRGWLSQGDFVAISHIDRIYYYQKMIRIKGSDVAIKHKEEFERDARC